MIDLIDVLSPAGVRTGETLPRADIHRLGRPHRAVHLYLFNARNELLLQRRSLRVDHAAGAFSVSVVGHVDAGEYSALTMRREVEEELGLSARGLRLDFVFSYFQSVTLNETYIDQQFNDVYVTRADLDLATLHFNRAELTELQFVPLTTFRAMLADPATGFGVYYGREWRDLEYFLADWWVQ
jgi:isopentenyl-diphosphate Delta-isomerase